MIKKTIYLPTFMCLFFGSNILSIYLSIYLSTISQLNLRGI